MFWARPKLREERLRRGWSLTRLCVEAGGIDISVLSKIERRIYPCGPKLRGRIAQAMGIPEAELFEEVPDHEAPVGYRPASSPR